MEKQSWAESDKRRDEERRGEERREEKRRGEKRSEEKRRDKTRRDETIKEGQRRSKKIKEDQRRSKKIREDQRRSERCAKEVDKSRFTVFFPLICGSEGSKSRLAKAGAEPSGQMRNEKLHSVVARSTFRSQKC